MNTQKKFLKVLSMLTIILLIATIFIPGNGNRNAVASIGILGYGPLTNENLAGEALSEFKGRINVTTKFGHEVIDGKGTGLYSQLLCVLNYTLET